MATSMWARSLGAAMADANPSRTRRVASASSYARADASRADWADSRAIQDAGVVGVIIGKALYSGALDLKAALDLTFHPNSNVD